MLYLKKEPSRWGRSSGRDSEVGLLDRVARMSRFPMGTAHVRKESVVMTQVALHMSNLLLIMPRSCQEESIYLE